MRFDKLEKYFESEESLSKLLDDCTDTFNDIDDLRQQLQQNIITTPEEYKQALNRATGCYMFLNPVYTTAIAKKENEELKYFVRRKEEVESKGEKVNATALEKESSASVEVYRKIRNILEGYTEAAEKAIGTIQSQLKRLDREQSLPEHKPEEGE